MDAKDLRTASEKWKKQLKKDVRSWRESVRYRVRNLKARTQPDFAGSKEQPRKGEQVDGDENTGRKSKDARDLLGDPA